MCRILLFSSSVCVFFPPSSISPFLLSPVLFPPHFNCPSSPHLSVYIVFVLLHVFVSWCRPPPCFPVMPPCVHHQYLLQCLPVVCFRFLLLEFSLISYVGFVCTLLLPFWSLLVTRFWFSLISFSFNYQSSSLVPPQSHVLSAFGSTPCFPRKQQHFVALTAVANGKSVKVVINISSLIRL